MFTVPKVLSVVPSPLNRRPCITAVGSRVPPKFEYASKVHIYEPVSAPTLQTCASSAPVSSGDRWCRAARAVVDVPSAIAPTKLINAHAKRKLPLINFVFTIVFSNFLFLLGVL